MKRDEGYIYILGYSEEGFFKVGTSLNPEARTRSLRTGNPSIRLVASYPTKDMRLIEQLVHNRLRACKVWGEWFRLDAAMLGWLQALLSGKPVGSPPWQPASQDSHRHRWQYWHGYSQATVSRP